MVSTTINKEPVKLWMGKRGVAYAVEYTGNEVKLANWGDQIYYDEAIKDNAERFRICWKEHSKVKVLNAFNELRRYKSDYFNGKRPLVDILSNGRYFVLSNPIVNAWNPKEIDWYYTSRNNLSKLFTGEDWECPLQFYIKLFTDSGINPYLFVCGLEFALSQNKPAVDVFNSDYSLKNLNHLFPFLVKYPFIKDVLELN